MEPEVDEFSHWHCIHFGASLDYEYSEGGVEVTIWACPGCGVRFTVNKGVW